MDRIASRTFKRVRTFIDQHSMLEGATGVVVAVSGGPDSLVLLDMLLSMKQRSSKDSALAGIKIHVAHIDHQLRGDESTADAVFVEALASRLGLPSTIESVNVQAK